MVAGLVVAGFGFAAGGAARSSTTVSMDAPTTPVLLVEPGVLGLVNQTVTVTATAQSPDQPILLAFAPTSDVDAWVGPAAHTRISGLESWDKLAAQVTPGEATVPDPHGSDLWRSELNGNGTLEVEITADPGQVTLLAATDGTAPAPRLTLTWPATGGGGMVPLLVLAAVLAIAGIGIVSFEFAHARGVSAKDRSKAKSVRLASANVTETTTIPVLEAAELAAAESADTELADTELADTGLADTGLANTDRFAASGAWPADSDRPLSRRELRKLVRPVEPESDRYAADGEWAAAGGAAGAAILPGLADAAKHRIERFAPDDPARFEPTPTADAEQQSRRGRRSVGTPISPSSSASAATPSTSASAVTPAESLDVAQDAAAVPPEQDEAQYIAVEIAPEAQEAAAAAEPAPYEEGVEEEQTSGQASEAAGEAAGEADPGEEAKPLDWRQLWSFRPGKEG